MASSKKYVDLGPADVGVALFVPGEAALKSPQEINHSLIDLCGPLLLSPMTATWQ